MLYQCDIRELLEDEVISKVSVNMNMQAGETVNLNKVLYVPQSVKNFLSVSKLLSKGATIGYDQDKMIIKKNGINMILDARKVKNASMIFYLKKK